MHQSQSDWLSSPTGIRLTGTRACIAIADETSTPCVYHISAQVRIQTRAFPFFLIISIFLGVIKFSQYGILLIKIREKTTYVLLFGTTFKKKITWFDILAAAQYFVS
jgi:hypothetical protein